MSFGDFSSTALISYNPGSRSALYDWLIRESFETQVADYKYFYCGGLRDVFERLSSPLIRITQPQIRALESLDSAITNAQELARMQLFLRRMNKCMPSCLETFELAYQKNVFLLNKTVARINASSIGDLKGKDKKITELFFCTLPKCQYDRGLIRPRSALESVLDNAVHQAPHQMALVDPITGQKIQETIREAHLALRLGVRPKKAYSEYHSVYYLLDRTQRKIGVFKPSIHVDPREDRYGASEDREAHLAEVASSSVDRFLETGVVPYTQRFTCTLPSSKATARVTGSFQFYVDGCDLDSQLEGENRFDPNHEELAIRLDTSANRELEFRNLEEFALFDLLTANNDHHFKNILLKKVAEKVWDLVAIDNANSFPWCHNLDLPSYKIPPNHWFKWSALPQAKKPFSQSMIDRINGLDLDRLEEIARDELVAQDVPSSKEHIEGKIKTMRDRFDRIQLLAKKGASLREIAKDILTLTCAK